ncbi:MAG: PAS domain S-box protein [Methanospirillum sp.]|nr:PAS domain S-box protein [Methanospirillum sp.]
MAGMDGISFLQAVRREFGDVPFVLFTGRGREEVMIAAINNGADFYLQKGGDPMSQYAALAHGIRQAIGRREAERGLRRGEEQFRRIMDRAKDMVYRMSLPDETFTFVSPASEEITGYRPDEFYADPGMFWRLASPDWQERVERIRADLREGRVPPRYDLRILDREGRSRWLDQQNIPVLGEDGALVALEAIVTDVTAQREAELELRKSRELLRQVFDQLPDGIALVDLDLRIRMANRSLCRMLGYAEEDLVGKTISSITHPDDEPVTVSEAGRLQRGDIPIIRLEKRYLRKDGSAVRSLVAVSPFLDENGSVVQFMPLIRELPDG